MRFGISLFIFAGAAFVVNAALAFPDGAPWGAANPSAEQHCATCHFEADPVTDSDALRIEDLPTLAHSGTVYTFKIVFEDGDMASAGFQLIADANDEPAGRFVSTEPGIEFIGGAVRSTSPANSNDGVSWLVQWQAPVEISSTIVFYLAASAANDDGSPFGDTIYYRSYEIPMN